MPRLAFETLSQQVKSGSIPPAIYLYGEEDVLKDEVIRAVLDRVVEPGVRDFNYDQRSASQLDAEAVETLCNTLPMMADRRLVVIREVEAWQKRAKSKAAVLRYLEKPAPATVLILVQSVSRRDDDRDGWDVDLLRLTSAVEVTRYGQKLAEKWVLKRAEDRGIRLAPDAAAHLVKAVEGDLGAARSELDKLAGLGDDEVVSLEQLVASLGIRHGETATDWCDAVTEDLTSRAAGILPYVLSQPGASGVGLVTQLGTQLVGLGLARACYDRGLRAGNLGRAIREALLRTRPPVRLDYRTSAERWSRLAENWPAARIDTAIGLALRADRRLKGTSLGDERGVLLDLVLEMAPGAQAEP